MNLPCGKGKSNLYLDLAKEFSVNKHDAYIIAPTQPHQKEGLHIEHNVNVLRINTLKQTNVKNVFLKGLAQVLLPHQFKRGYKKYLKDIKFDLVLMPTPPITLVSLANYIKRLNNCPYYLILRDIYPQGAADLGLVKSKLMYNYLKNLETTTYSSADIIGCMSQGNIDYIANHNPYIPPKKLVLLPNWQKNEKDSIQNSDIRKKYKLENKYIVLFGGTIGYAQKIDNIITMAIRYKDYNNIVFLVIGKGVMKEYFEDKVRLKMLTNVVIFESFPRSEYLAFVKASDIGVISIDERFTVPTIPSKTTAYMNFSLPILAIIDAHTDYGKILDEAHAGLWSIGGDDQKLFENFDKLYNDKNLRLQFGENGYNYFLNTSTSEIAYKNVINQLKSLN